MSDSLSGIRRPNTVQNDGPIKRAVILDGIIAAHASAGVMSDVTRSETVLKAL